MIFYLEQQIMHFFSFHSVKPNHCDHDFLGIFLTHRKYKTKQMMKGVFSQ